MELGEQSFPKFEGSDYIVKIKESVKKLMNLRNVYFEKFTNAIFKEKDPNKVKENYSILRRILVLILNQI